MDLEDMRFWLDCLDWFLQLSPERELALRQELERLDKEQDMAFVNFIERQALEKGIEQGMEKGRREALQWYLKARFGDETLAWLAAAEQVSDEKQRKELYERLFKANTLEQVQAILAPSAGSTPPEG
jgi:hypothetical protein